RQDLAEPFGSVDDRHRAFRARPGNAEAEPPGERHIRFPARERASLRSRLLRAVAAEKRRIGKDMIEPGLKESFSARPGLAGKAAAHANVRRNDRAAILKSCGGRIFRSEGRKLRLQLNGKERGAGQPMERAKPGGTDPCPDIEQRLPRLRLDGGGQQHGVGAGAKSPSRLPYFQRPAEKIIARQIPRHFAPVQSRRHAGGSPSPISSRICSARGKSSSVTMIRRWIAPMLPSRMAVCSSRRKVAIPSSSRTAVR